MIQIEQLKKKRGNFLLSDINLTLPKGYICGLIGENGAGKTTLLHTILGLYPPDDGSILIDGRSIRQEEQLVKDDIGYVLAEDLFDDYLSLLDNATVYGKYYSRYNQDVFLAYCQRFQLNPQQKLKKHSKGEKLKFQFAFALSHDPKLLVLDEPTANFDPQFREDFFKILSDFISDGEKTVVLATHLTSDLDRIGDYITFLHKGKLLFSMDKTELEKSFRIVSGEDYKVNLLPKEKFIYKDKTDYGSKALIRHSRLINYDSTLAVDIPTIEEIMYYCIKGDAHV